MAVYLLITALAALCYTALIRCCVSGRSACTCRQLRAANMLLPLVYLSMLLGDSRRDTGRGCYLAADVCWLAAAGYGFAALRRIPEQAGAATDAGERGGAAQISTMAGIRDKGWTVRIGTALWHRLPMIGLMAAALILAIEPGRIQLRWDGALYEQACRGMDIHSLSSIGAYGHLSQGYGSLFCLLNHIIGDAGLTLAVMNIALYLCSIVGFFLLIRHLVPGKKEITYLLGTAVYAFSPFTLGMVNYYSVDYVTLCLFVWVCYFAFTGKWIYHFLVSVVFVFTKEPAIVTYGGFCAGMVAAGLLREGSTAREKLTRMLRHLEYYSMLLIGVLWIVMYRLLGGWSGGEGAFLPSLNYVADKLKVLYVLNFNWLMVFAALAGGILLLSGKKRKESGGEEGKTARAGWVIPLLCSLAAFTLFSIAFQTVNHARYAASAPVILYLLAFALGAGQLREAVGGVVTAAVAVLMLFSSYLTIDPVSRACFQTVDIGNRTMLTTGSAAAGDGMIYNKQMLYEEYALNQAIGHALEREYMIFFPTYEGTAYSFDGSMAAGEEKDGYIEVGLYWDRRKGRRTIYANEDTQAFFVREVTGEILDVWKPETESGRSCYIYLQMMGAQEAVRIREEYRGMAELVFAYRGWEVRMLVPEG